MHDGPTVLHSFSRHASRWLVRCAVEGKKNCTSHGSVDGLLFGRTLTSEHLKSVVLIIPISEGWI